MDSESSEGEAAGTETGPRGDADSCLQVWATACKDTLEAFNWLHSNSNKPLGEHRSISLVLMRPMAVPVAAPGPACSCVRCKWGGDSDTPDLLWITWVGVSQTHGMMGRAGRQVCLDEENRILYSFPDTRMQSTGFSMGYGFPQLVCDDNHADILVGYVGSAMTKVSKRSKDRQQVCAQALKLHTFCENMVAALATSYQAALVLMDAMGCSRLTPSP